MESSNVFALFVIFFCSFPLSYGQAPGTFHFNLPAGVVGPETITFDCNGNGPYVGVSDGRILKWQGRGIGWTEFARTVAQSEVSCGRPLGLKFHPTTCELYIADAYLGLMKVGREGGVAQSIVSHVNGIPLKFTNDLDIDPESGVIYFTDTSTRYSRWQWELIVSTQDLTGRLLRYDPNDGSVSVLLGGLAFANGVALSKDRSFLLVAETTPGQIRKYWQSGPRRHSSEIFVQLGGRPDNINLNADGNFWIAQNPTLPGPFAQRTGDRGRPVKIDSSGNIIEILENAGSTSHVTEFNNRIWLGSVTNAYIGIK